MDTLYGIVALPPQPLRRWIENFQKRHSLAAYGEAHLNLRSPFGWGGSESELMAALERHLGGLPPLEVRLGKWDRFSSTVFIGVEKTVQLEQFHRAALEIPGAQTSSFDGDAFSPHLTVALGICPWAYRRIWREIHSEDVPVARWTSSELYLARDAGGELERVGKLELGKLESAKLESGRVLVAR